MTRTEPKEYVPGGVTSMRVLPTYRLDALLRQDRAPDNAVGFRAL